MDTVVAVDVPEAARRLSVPERSAWKEIASGRLRSFKVGRRRLVAVTELAAYVERQADQAGRAGRGKASVSAPAGAAAPARAPAPVAPSAPRRPTTLGASDDSGIRLPFIELPDGTVTPRSSLRRVSTRRRNPRG